MLRALKLISVFYRTSVQTDAEYRADFFARVIASLVGLGTTLGSLWIAFQYTPHLKGWSLSEALVLVAMYYLMDGLIEMFIAPNMRETMTQVREGTLDFVLLKPISSQFMATFRTINIWRAANLLVGLSLATYCINRLALNVGWQQALLFAGTLLAGLCVIYSFWLVLVTLTFWFVKVDNIEQIVWQAFEAGRYPVEIYPGWLRMVLTYGIPIVFIITVPAQALSGRLAPQFVLVAFAVAAGSLVASSLFWRFGLRYYTGASA
jgi:ABC-2 type transport system permease protein